MLSAQQVFRSAEAFAKQKAIIGAYMSAHDHINADLTQRFQRRKDELIRCQGQEYCYRTIGYHYLIGSGLKNSPDCPAMDRVDFDVDDNLGTFFQRIIRELLRKYGEPPAQPKRQIRAPLRA